jgi:hypothetical protein
MKTIMATYPDFHTLPKGVKMMLLASEVHFFNETNPPGSRRREKAPEISHGLLPPVAIQNQAGAR